MPDTGPVGDDLTERARRLAADAAQAAGIAVREVHEVGDLAAVRRLFDTLWSADPTNPAATVELLRAYAHTGQYVVLASDLTAPGHPPIAASMGFLAAPPGVALHSNVTGVLPAGRGRSLGFALKAHQRAWALEHGLREVTWTFDPLIRRNAWFNLAKLGARVQEYLVDFYGAMTDGINAGDASDRLYTVWSIADPGVAAVLADGAGGIDLAAARAAGAVEVLAVDTAGGPATHWPTPAGVDVVLAQVPADVEALRRSDPRLAREWRRAARTVLDGALAAGWTVRGFGRDGWYVLDRHETEDAR
jgi:predicted GNAT superfamily acetyltransferase